MSIETVDIVALIGQRVPLKRVGHTGGGEFHGPCPLCGGKDRLYVQASSGRGGRGMWRCRMCNEGGDALSFLMKTESLTYPDACTRLGVVMTEKATPLPPKPLDPVSPPHTQWQSAALAFVERCEMALWRSEGARALSYLHGRGFTSQTIREARLGYCVADEVVPRASFGLPENPPHNSLRLSRGITIPWFIGADLWRVNTRRPVPLRNYDVTVHGSKYIPIPAPEGARNVVYGIDTIKHQSPLILVEGEFNALAVRQATTHCAVALGASTHGRRVRWVAAIGRGRPVLVATDRDPDPRKGDAAAAYWTDVLRPHGLRWSPTEKDCAAMLASGANMQAWADMGVARALGVAPPTSTVDVMSVLEAATHIPRVRGSVNNQDEVMIGAFCVRRVWSGNTLRSVVIA